jgi:putative ABC transport system substrate-binding protein
VVPARLGSLLRALSRYGRRPRLEREFCRVNWISTERPSRSFTRRDDFRGAFATAAKGRADALYVATTGVFFRERAQIAQLAVNHRLPAVSTFREFAEAGGLMSYGANLPDMFRRAAIYVDKILKGAKAGDLPLEQPTKFELVINLKTAEALGLTIPPSLLQRADQVIE